MALIRTELFREFFQSEKSSGFILIGCTIVSMIIANSVWGEGYAHFWHSYVNLSFSGIDLNYSIEHWINDGLMAVFFLLVGLEIERELYVGELSDFKNAVLPIAAAIGGMVVPALIYYLFTAGTPAVGGFGIPMATDIAFALGILSLVGNKVPISLKVFLTALAIIDDLGAITVIALFYTDNFSFTYFISALGMFGLLFLLGKLKVYRLGVYLIGGVIMWYCMLKSGVHATIAGVLLAFAIPFPKEKEKNPSYKLQHALHHIVGFFIVPLFALANTAIILPKTLVESLTNKISMGIMFGLVLGKLAGILGAAALTIRLGLSKLPTGANWRYMTGIALLGGIGFTMSIFITNLAFIDPLIINSSKLSILSASLLAAISGLLVLKWAKKRKSFQRS